MGTQSWKRGRGPLVPFADGFRARLLEIGHREGTLKTHLMLMGRLNRWLGAEGLGVEELTSEVLQRFLDHLRTGVRRVPTLKSLTPLLDYLRASAVLPAEPTADPTPREELLAAYHRHLIDDRGLRATTVRRYENFARRFLAERARRTGTEAGTKDITSAEVSAYLLEASTRLAVESAKREAADLRALLRYLHVAGILEADLGTAMPPVATWRGTALPPTMSPTDVGRLLASCDRSTISGRRDLAVLMLLARLGLRAAEVAGLKLGDIDWRAGEILVRGKAGRKDQLPLPVEVGKALVHYLRCSRPYCECRFLILTLYAPFRPIHPSSITTLVYRACQRAGFAQVGAHRLRHALATEMLRKGGDLVEIAQVLRHSDLNTTAGYAKVDRVALRSVAACWPGATG
jgi:site-specific recombinase XerD